MHLLHYGFLNEKKNINHLLLSETKILLIEYQILTLLLWFLCNAQEINSITLQNNALYFKASFNVFILLYCIINRNGHVYCKLNSVIASTFRK